MSLSALAGMLPQQVVVSAPVVYESFDYTAGENIDEKDGGFGFNDYWYDSSVDQNPIVLDSLPYAGLETAGNSLLMAAPTNPLTHNVRRYFDAIPGTADSTTWVSFLFALENTAEPIATGDWAALGVGTNSLFAQGPFFGVYNDPDGDPGEKVFGIGSSATTPVELSTVSLVQGETYFLVARIDWNPLNTADKVSLFINPTPGVEPEIAAVTADMLIQINTTKRLVSVGMFTGGLGTEWAYDEIRIGAAYDDVAIAVVPEPSVGGLALLACGFFALRRKFFSTVEEKHLLNRPFSGV